MDKKLIVKCILILVCMFISFVANGQKDVIEIDMSTSIYENLPMSKFVSKVEYIALELTDYSILNDPIVYLTDKYIITVELFDKICVFNRQNGQFIRNLSQKGNGPNDYLFPVLYNALNKKDNVFFVDTWDKWRGINIETNKCVKEIRKPQSRYADRNKYQNYISNFYPYKEGLYIGFANNGELGNSYELFVFNEDGIVLETINNGGHVSPKIGDEALSDYGHFQKVGEQIFFKPAAQCDTVYVVTDKSLKPFIILNSRSIAGTDNNGYCNYVMQTDRYVFFNLNKFNNETKNLDAYSNVYDKKKRLLYSCKKQQGVEKSGFFNDIDGIGPFYPIQIEGKELIGVLKISDLLVSLNKENLSRKGTELLKNIRRDDNPIIIIVTLKE